MKLTPKQDAVIWCLQNGWILITDSELNGALVAKNKKQFHINNGLFFRLLNKGLIAQQIGPPFEFVLTESGKLIKTKKYEI